MSSVARKRKWSKGSIKDHVVKAATAAFCEKGIRNVRMDDLASELSISKRTLYELFGDKEELLLEVLKAHHKNMADFMAEVAEKAENVLEVIFTFYQKTTQDLQTTNRLFFEDVKRYPKVMAYEENNRDETRSSALAFYQRGVEQGIFRNDINFRIIQVMMQGQMDMLIRSEIAQAYSLVELFETLVFMHMRGISTEKGLKMMDDFLNHLKQQKLETI